MQQLVNLDQAQYEFPAASGMSLAPITLVVQRHCAEKNTPRPSEYCIEYACVNSGCMR